MNLMRGVPKTITGWTMGVPLKSKSSGLETHSLMQTIAKGEVFLYIVAGVVSSSFFEYNLIYNYVQPTMAAFKSLGGLEITLPLNRRRRLILCCLTTLHQVIALLQINLEPLDKYNESLAMGPRNFFRQSTTS